MLMYRKYIPFFASWSASRPSLRDPLHPFAPCSAYARDGLIKLRAAKVVETNDIDENTLIDFDENGKICGITIEHAADRVDLPNFSFERMAA